MSLYVIKSPIWKKNIYKIGYTTQTQKGLFNRYRTALGDVEIKYMHKFTNYKEKEKELHKLLSKYRIWERREFFKCNFITISLKIDIIENKKSSLLKIIKGIFY
jgi:hypothetical protein